MITLVLFSHTEPWLYRHRGVAAGFRGSQASKAAACTNSAVSAKRASIAKFVVRLIQPVAELQQQPSWAGSIAEAAFK